MREIGRTVFWLEACLLLCGGCVSSALDSRPADSLVAQLPPAQGTSSESSALGSQATDGQKSAIGHTDADRIQATLIRDLAAKQGYTDAQASAILTELTNATPQTRPVLTQIVLSYLARDSASEPAVEPTVLEPTAMSTGSRAPMPTTDPRQHRTAGEARLAQLRQSSRRQPPATTLNGTAAARPRGPAVPAAGDSNQAQQTAQSANFSDHVATRPSASPIPPADGSVRGAAVADSVPADAGELVPGTAPVAAPQPVNWRKKLRDAARALEQELHEGTLDEHDLTRQQNYLALIYLALEDREQALQTIDDSRDAQELEFWRQTLMGLGILLAPDELPKFKYRAESAAACFRDGESSLASLGPLHLNQLAFCTKVTGFGDYDEFDSYVFRPGQQVILYVEVENYTVEQIDAAASGRHFGGLQSKAKTPRYETELHGKYEVLDAQQRTIVARTLPIDRNRCRNHRRDYFIPYMLYLPKKIEPGSYTLELVIEDKKGDKYGSAVIDFRIR